MKFLRFAMIACCLLAVGCVKPATKADLFPGMYTEQPRSILVLPPINLTTAADAKECYITTVSEPLSHKGYYVYPAPVVMELMQSEGLYDSELLYNADLQGIRTNLGADSVLFTKITAWDMSYMVISSSMTVGIDCELRSTLTNNVLWKHDGEVTVDLSGGSEDLIVQLIASAVNSAMADYVDVARRVNDITLSTLPAGPYSQIYLQDQDEVLVDQDMWGPTGQFP